MKSSLIVPGTRNNVKQICDISDKLHITFNDTRKMLLEIFIFFQTLDINSLQKCIHIKMKIVLL